MGGKAPQSALLCPRVSWWKRPEERGQRSRAAGRPGSALRALSLHIGGWGAFAGLAPHVLSAASFFVLSPESLPAVPSLPALRWSCSVLSYRRRRVAVDGAPESPETGHVAARAADCGSELGNWQMTQGGRGELVFAGLPVTVRGRKGLRAQTQNQEAAVVSSEDKWPAVATWHLS